jgi:hypothetical protein
LLPRKNKTKKNIKGQTSPSVTGLETPTTNHPLSTVITTVVFVITEQYCRVFLCVLFSFTRHALVEFKSDTAVLCFDAPVDATI